MIPFPITAIIVLTSLIVIGALVWLMCGWLADKYDAWRTDNWKGW